MNTRIMFGITALFVMAVGFSANADAANYNHPWRHEVAHRDNRIAHELNFDRGHLGGHYAQLKHEDRAIRRQEWRDARMNGGHLTPWEHNRLNREENHLQHQINRDARY